MVIDVRLLQQGILLNGHCQCPVRPSPSFSTCRNSLSADKGPGATPVAAVSLSGWPILSGHRHARQSYLIPPSFHHFGVRAVMV